jgi:hypothetical protein
MEPTNNRFGGGVAASILHPLVAIAVVIAIVLILSLQRKKVIVPFLFAALMTPWGQVLVLGGVHFTMIRILILTGLARAAWSKTGSSERWFATGFSRIDQAAVLWIVFWFVGITLQWMNSQMLIASLGDLVDFLGGYLVLRFLIPDGEAIRRTAKVLAAICVVHGISMIYEQITHVNAFDFLGGVPISSTIRVGQLRSSGVMGPLGEGVFAGVLVPLFLWLWTEQKCRMLAFAGLAGGLAMLITSHASSPWMACAGAILGLSFWPLRKEMRIIRWGIVFMLLALNMYMKSPVWHLIDDVNVTGDSSSYHRYFLVDATIRHFTDWWLIGYKNYDTWGSDMWDTSNLFVSTAVSGGLVSLAFLIAAFSVSFGAIGTARKRVNGDRKQEWLLWCLGSALFAVVVSSFGIAFLYQSQMAIFVLLSCISVATFEATRAAVKSGERGNLQGSKLVFVPATTGLRSKLAGITKQRIGS